MIVRLFYCIWKSTVLMHHHTKELIIDLRTKKANPVASSIHGKDIQIVDTYKYLGTVFDESHLKFDTNIESLVKRGQQKVYLLKRISSLKVTKLILCTVYSSILSLITF